MSLARVLIGRPEGVGDDIVGVRGSRAVLACGPAGHVQPIELRASLRLIHDLGLTPSN